MSTQIQLHALSLDMCAFIATSSADSSGSAEIEALSHLKDFNSLCSLHLQVGESEADHKMPVGHLAALQQLRSLSLLDCSPVGLEHVLSSVPLTSLALHNIVLPLGLRLRSDTLETVSIELLSHEVPFSSEDLPCLQLIELRCISLPANEGDLQATVGRLSSLPLVHLGRGLFTLRGSATCTNEACMNILQYLARPGQLGAFFSRVQRLSLVSWPLGPGAMLLINRVFSDVKYVSASKSICFDDFGIYAAIAFSKSLRVLVLEVRSLPADILMALMAAAQCFKPFHLSLSVSRDQHPNTYGELLAIEQQWRTSKILRTAFPPINFLARSL